MVKTQETENDDKCLNTTDEDRAAMQSTELYIIDSDKVKSVQDAVDLHSEVKISKNHKVIGWIVDIPMSYWVQNHEN